MPMQYFSVHIYYIYVATILSIPTITGVRPDIVTVGKPMGNGHPISAVITTKKIARDYLTKHPDTCGEVSLHRAAVESLIH